MITCAAAVSDSVRTLQNVCLGDNNTWDGTSKIDLIILKICIHGVALPLVCNAHFGRTSKLSR
eukprot:5370316-Amphidinium_carterae.1